MPDPSKRLSPELSEVLQFRPRWWWDPVPWWFFEHLRPESVRELAAIQLEFDRTVVEAQLRTIDKTMEVIRQMK
jgi:hypothetical protein